MEPSEKTRFRISLFAAFLILALAGAAWAVTPPKDSGSYLEQKAFFKPELYISSSHVAVEEVLDRLPNRAAWESYLAAREKAGPARRTCRRAPSSTRAPERPPT